jgi:hypothetical protein
MNTGNGATQKANANKSLQILYETKVKKLNEQTVTSKQIQDLFRETSRHNQQQRNQVMSEKLQPCLSDIQKCRREYDEINEEIHLIELREAQMKFHKTPNIKSLDQWFEVYGRPSPSNTASSVTSNALNRTRAGNTIENRAPMKQSLFKKTIPTATYHRPPELANMSQWFDAYGRPKTTGHN